MDRRSPICLNPFHHGLVSSFVAAGGAGSVVGLLNADIHTRICLASFCHQGRNRPCQCRHHHFHFFSSFIGLGSFDNFRCRLSNMCQTCLRIQLHASYTLWSNLSDMGTS